MSSAFREKNLHFSIEIPNNETNLQSFLCDTSRIKQVMLNFLTNSAKYTDKVILSFCCYLLLFLLVVVLVGFWLLVVGCWLLVVVCSCLLLFVVVCSCLLLFVVVVVVCCCCCCLLLLLLLLLLFLLLQKKNNNNQQQQNQNEQGSVTLQMKLETEEQDGPQFECRVKDTGKGISDEWQHVIFDAFTQVDNTGVSSESSFPSFLLFFLCCVSFCDKTKNKKQTKTDSEPKELDLDCIYVV